MKRTVIIFDGEEDHEIGLSYFYQNPLIESANPDQIVEYYISTTILAEVVRDIVPLIKEGTVKTINDKAIGLDYLKKVESGVSILETMLEDLFGKESAQYIIETTKSKTDE
jgi:hypothetical protein